MTFARSLLPVVLAVASAASAPLPAWAQSDETCIAYFEADAVYHDEIRAIQKNLAAALQREPRRTSPDGPVLATNADVKAYLAEADAKEKRRQAHLAAYKGPGSSVASVMEMLISGDRRRCYKRFRGR